MRINHNISAMSVKRVITRQSRTVQRQVETLSSGLRVKRAANDASGVSISEGLRSQVTGLNQNVRNTEQASDLLQVAEGGLREVSGVLIHMRELATRAADGNVTDEQRNVIAAEFRQMRAAIDRIAQATTYNGQAILAGATRVDADQSSAMQQQATTGLVEVYLSGAQAGAYTFNDDGVNETLTLGNGVITQTVDLSTQLDAGSVAQDTQLRVNFDRLGIALSLDGASVTDGYAAGDLDGTTLTLEEAQSGSFLVGPTDEAYNQLDLELPDLRASSDPLGLSRVSVSSMDGARQALSALDIAVSRVTAERGKIGALQNRMAFSLSLTDNEIENMSGSESTIRDADVAAESTGFSRSLILARSSSAMLVHAFDTARQSLQLL